MTANNPGSIKPGYLQDAPRGHTVYLLVYRESPSARAYLRTRQRVWADAIAGVFRAAGQLCEVGRCSPVDL
jgi:hypothetical protein